jgi:outer membrane lipoprotein-sorting protein
MDAKTLLQQVAEHYENLKSLAVEIISITETGDDDSSHRAQQRVSGLFVAPDKLRIEQRGEHGSIAVTSGIDIHSYSFLSKAYSKTSIAGQRQLLGHFQPEFPVVGDSIFLFGRIADRVVDAEVLPEETFKIDIPEADCHVIRVKYEPTPNPVHVYSPVTFWVNSDTHLIVKSECQMTYRIPLHEETHRQKNVVYFRNATINQRIPPETFEYTPPADALDASGPGRLRARSKSGRARFSGDEKGWVESSHSGDWAGDAFVEEYKLKLRGIQLTFERRLSFSEGLTEVHVSERITSPKGETEHDFLIPVI